MIAYCLRHGSNVGSGVLASQQKLDEEFQQLLRQHNLCALNTWGRARASHCATYINGSTRAQIDFVLTRLQHADPQARAAAPIELNLAPWRLGSRHRPVCASIPWMGGWERRNRRPHTTFGYSLPDLRAASSQQTLMWQQFCAAAQDAISRLPVGHTIGMLNRTILPLCGKFFPHRAKVSRPPVFRSESVQQALAAMKRQLDAHRSPGRGRFQAWQGWAAFRASHKSREYTIS